MTYTRYELIRIECDLCCKKAELAIYPDQVNPLNPTEAEDCWLAELRKQGWTYDDSSDCDYCPNCSTKPEIISILLEQADKR